MVSLRICYFRCVGVAVLLLLSACAPQLPTAPEQLTYPALVFKVPDVETLEFENGIKLYLQQNDELPLVQVTALFASGTIGVPHELAGFGSVFAETWRTGGTLEDSPERLEERLEVLAADLTAGMGTYTTQLDLSVRSQDIQEGFDILAGLLRRPAFAVDSFELARLQALENVRRQNDLPRSIAQRLLMASLYPEHPLGLSPSVDSLTRLNREDLEQFQRRHFVPNHLRLAISGDFDRTALLTLLETLFGDWSVGEVASQPLPPISPARAGGIQVVDKKLAQTTILLGDVGLTKDNPDQYAVRVMNFILGGGGFNSRLMQEIRSNRGLAYSAYSYFQIGRKLPGPFVVSTETRTESVHEVLGLIRDIMQDVRDHPVSALELRVARDSLVNSFVFGFDDSHAVVTQRMRQDLFNYPPDYLQRYRERIAAVTAADIQRVARIYLRPERQQIVLVGDADVLNDDLSLYELPIRWADIDASP